MDLRVTERLQDFIKESYLFGDDSRMPAENDSLLQTGILDSTGVLELIEFLESEWGFQVEDTETVPDNLDSIAALTRYVALKCSQSAGVA